MQADTARLGQLVTLAIAEAIDSQDADTRELLHEALTAGVPLRLRRVGADLVADVGGRDVCAMPIGPLYAMASAPEC